MPFKSIDDKISTLEERLHLETFNYRKAISEEKPFTEVKELFTMARGTLKEIKQLYKDYGEKLDDSMDDFLTDHEL